MRKLRVVAIVAASIGLAACATGPYKYKDYDSFALNLANAGNVQGVSDQRISQEEADNLNNNTYLIDSVLTGSIANSPPPGFSNGFSIGLGIATMLLSPTTYKSGAYNQLVAWMPKAEARSIEDSQNQFESIITLAIEAGLKKLDFFVVDSSSSYGRNDSKILNFKIANETPDWNCNKLSSFDATCSLSVRISQPLDYGHTPVAISKEDTPSYFYYASDENPSQIILNGNFDSANKPIAIYSAISKELPNWAYIYVAPPFKNDLTRQNHIKAPIIYHQGKLNFFVKPKN